MLLLLLVSIQGKLMKMEVYEFNIDLLSDKTKTQNESRVPIENEKILCNHCKRTASNGVRCLGMCVADNDY